MVVTKGSGQAGLEKQLGLKVTADVKQAVKNLKEVARTTREIRQVSKGTTKTVTSSYNAAGSVIKKTSSTVKDFRSKFNFAFLSTMFMGMQMQRTFGGMIKSAVTGFKNIAGATHPVSLAFSRLDANVNFLKFALVDAIGPDIINRIADFADKMANMKPENLERVGKAIIGLAAAGTLMFTFSQIQLFIQGVAGIFAEGTGAGAFVSSFKKNIGKFFTKIGLPKDFKAGKAILGAGLAIHATVNAFKILNDDGTTLVENALNVAEATIAGALIGSVIPVVGTAVGAAVGFSVSLIINTADIFIEGFKDVTIKTSENARKDLVKPFVEFLGRQFNFARFVVEGPQILTDVFSATGKLSTDSAEAAEVLKPTLENLTAASILANTSASEISALGRAIGTDLKPSFEKVNPFLATAKEELDGINTNTNKFIERTDDFNTNVNDRTTRVKDLASAYLELAQNTAKANKVESEDLTEVPSVAVSGING